MFEMFVVAFVCLIVGVVLEYHFALYQKVVVLGLLIWGFVRAAFVQSWRWLFAQRWFLWFGRFAFLSGALGLALMIMLLVMSLKPPSTPLAGDTWSMWEWFGPAIVAFFGVVAAVLALFFEALWGLASLLWNVAVAVVKWIVGVLAAVVMLLPPSCGEKVPTVEATPVSLMPVMLDQKAPRPQPLWILVEVEEGDGCISATRRVGQPLTLLRCLELTRIHGLQPVRNARGFLEAPRLYPGDVLEWEEGRGWMLLR